jgi:porin
MRGLKIGPLRLRGRAVRLAALAGLLALLVPTVANAADAECGVTDSGIPDGVFAPIDVAHIRKSLADLGFGLGGSYVGEAFANTGGINQGGKYDGVLTLNLNANLKKMGLWKGLCLSASAFQIHGQSITADNIGSLMPVSNLEATPATRLFELWVEQHMFNDVLAVKVGQLAADQEFILSNSYSYFLNGTWGWPSIAANDLPGGGPAYPLATPGVRIAIKPNDNFKLMIGVYNGDPADPNCANENPQVCNSDGLDFNLDSPALLMIEGRYKYNQSGQLPGTIKLGGWNHFGTFPDERLDSDDLPIAATLNRGRPIDGDWAIYGIIDQLVWRLPGSEDAKGVGLFGRIMGAPSAQNLVNFYIEAGITFSGMIPHRADDLLGIGVAYTGVSDRMHGFDLDSGLPVARTSETVLEICYTAQLMPGWTLKPDFQYFWQPGGNVPDESGNGAVENAAVFGARTTLSF